MNECFPPVKTSIQPSIPLLWVDMSGNILWPSSIIWKPLKCYNHGIYLVYTRHMTTSVICKVYTWYIPVIWQGKSYDRYIPGIYLSWWNVIYMVYTWYIPFHFLMGYTWYIPSIYLLNENMRSARQQNCDWNAAAHRYWIARVFNVQRH